MQFMSSFWVIVLILTVFFTCCLFDAHYLQENSDHICGCLVHKNRNLKILFKAAICNFYLFIAFLCLNIKLQNTLRIYI